MAEKYVVTIKETLVKEIVVNGYEVGDTGKAAARDFVEKKWKNGEIILGGDDFFDVSFEVEMQSDEL